MRHRHVVRGGLVGVWLAVAASMLWSPHVLPGNAAVAAAIRARDTVADSLLVSDSIYQGWKWWHVYCYRCHGEDAIGGINPAAPDLRWALSATGANFPRDSFVNTALNGRLAKGMPSWKVLLDTSAIAELYLYVKARSDGWLKPGRPHRVSDLPARSK